MKQIKINSILEGDCLEQMRYIEKDSIDLIYLDPPFFTKKIHSLLNRERDKEFYFKDIWENNKEYADFLYTRISMMRDLLRDTGSIFVHCDKHGNHIIRSILDKVFGAENFQSEIIWCYKRWSNQKKGLLPNHQNIYFYSKTNKFKFNNILTSYSETTNIDQILQRRTRDEFNKSVYDVDDSGEFIHGDKKKGVPLSDVWAIPYLNPKAKERVGYPTQKPIILLERIIKLVTNAGDIVFDPFCGSGTTCVAAKLLDRNYIGIDQSKDAVDLSRQRIEHPIKTESALLKKGRKSYQNADQNALSLLQGISYNPVHRNKGIDAILVELHEGSPVLVRVQKENESILEVATLLQKSMKTKRAKKAILIQTSCKEILTEDLEFDGIVVIDAPAIQIKKIVELE